MTAKKLRAQLINAIPLFTHALAALVPLLWWSASERKHLSVILIVGAIVIGNLPDIDSAYTHIGRLIYPVAKRIESRYGHRTITHSLLPVAIIAVLAYACSLFIDSLFIGPWWWWPTFYLSHLVLDMIIGGKTGVPLVWPLKTKFWVAQIEGGSTGERVIFIILLIAAIIPLAINPSALSPGQVIRQATGDVETALYDYRQWEATHDVELEIEGTWQVDHRPITGTYQIDHVTGYTFHLLDDHGNIFTAGKSGDIQVYLIRAIAVQGPPRVAVIATPTSEPTTTISIRIPHVYDLQTEILVQAGDTVTTGQLLANLSTYRAIIATPTPTPPPTAGPTPTPANLDPLTVSRAEADLALAEARYAAAIAIPTVNPVVIATLAPEATAWAQYVQDREETLWRERDDPGGLPAWRARTELEQYSPQATAIAYRLDTAMHPPGPDPRAISIARAQLEIAQIKYHAAIATPTPRPWSTPSAPSVPSVDHSVDPTLIRALIPGHVIAIEIVSITGNEATVEIIVQVATETAHRGATAVATVIRVVDGDTAIFRLDDGSQETIRFIGINTPETKHPTKPIECYGPEASAYTESLLPPGTSVQLELDVQEYDKYNRLLAYIWLSDGRLLNELLLIEGYAQTMTIPPNVKYSSRFLEAEQQARANNAGLWGACP